jgi:hypothetical protein
MKRCVSLMLVLALALVAVPAFAGEGSGAPTAVGNTFQALRTLPAGEQAQLITLNDAQLRAIEGTQNVGVCVACLNAAIAANVLSAGSTAETGSQTINVGSSSN